MKERWKQKTYFAVGEGAELDELDDTVWNCGLAQAFDVLNDVVSLQADTDSGVEWVRS